MSIILKDHMDITPSPKISPLLRTSKEKALTRNLPGLKSNAAIYLLNKKISAMTTSHRND